MVETHDTGAKSSPSSFPLPFFSDYITVISTTPFSY